MWKKGEGRKKERKEVEKEKRNEKIRIGKKEICMTENSNSAFYSVINFLNVSETDTSAFQTSLTLFPLPDILFPILIPCLNLTNSLGST